MSKKKKNTKDKANGGGFFGNLKKKNNEKSPKNTKNDKNIKSTSPTPKISNSSRGTKKAKSKFKKFEKCPGYDSIIKAQNFEAEQKYSLAMKHYNIGCDELENYTKHNIDNALEKRNRMERIENYRRAMLKLQNEQTTKRKKTATNSPKPHYLPLNKEGGFKLVLEAMQCKNNDKLPKAIQLYEKGLTMLEQALPSITDSKEKENRRQKIREWRSEQQWCKNQMETRKLKNRCNDNNSKSVDKTRDIRDEAGYQYCCKAEQFEIDNKYDVAIQYYQRGIPMLEDTLKNINSSSKYRERMQKIESYRHKCQKLKNLKVRKKSQHTRSSTATSLPPTPRKSQIYNDPMTRKPSSMPLRHDLLGGILYKNIRNGTLSIDILKSCDRMSMYYILPIVVSSCIHLPLPFRSSIRDPLLEAVMCKIEISGSLQQRLRFFLFSYYSVDIVQALFGDHPSMPNVLMDGDDYDNDYDDNNEENKYREESDEYLFEDSYLEKDAILFYRKIIEIEPNVGDEINVDIEYMDIYDIMGGDSKINKIRIDKIFKSNAKPLLISTFQKQSDRKYKLISKFIIKYGDDLRLDSGAMHMFRFFNSIWSEEGLYYDGYPIQCLLYGVIPMGIDFGAIEFIPNCKPLRNVNDYFDKFGNANLKNLVASSAGSYIASFVLGVRDRHFDNVLIRNDGTLFHIDFGYVMGSKLFMDTSKIAITKDLQKLFENHWDNFVETAVNSYMTLRLHYQEILDYSDIVFDFVDLQCNSSEFLYKMLMINESDKKAEDYMRSKLIDAPSSWNTKIKNAAHYVATLDIESVVGWD